MSFQRAYARANATPRSVESFRLFYGRTPTVAEMRACLDFASPAPAVVSNGCDCYDPECSLCCDENGDAR